MHTPTDRTRLTRLVLIVLLAAAAWLGGCSESSRATAPTCQPQCAGKSGGDDACGGVCPVTSTSACGNCGPNGVCLDGKCVCTPKCDGTRAGDDGCGGSCACAPGTVADASGKCRAPEACTDTCKGSGLACGTVCGQTCGACDDGTACTGGKCLCVPKCDGSRCDDGCGGLCDCAAGSVCAADGRCVAPSACSDTCQGASRTCGTICGASCGTCAADEGCNAGKCKALLTCDDCDLTLHVLSASPGTMTVAIDYTPPPGDAGVARARLADVRVRASRAFRVTKLLPGDALAAAGKSLYADPATGQPWRFRADGALQMLVQSVASTGDIASGRVATMDVAYDGAGPVTLWVVRRDGVLAPPVADNELQASPYDAPVTVSR